MSRSAGRQVGGLGHEARRSRLHEAHLHLDPAVALDAEPVALGGCAEAPLPATRPSARPGRSSSTGWSTSSRKYSARRSTPQSTQAGQHVAQAAADLEDPQLRHVAGGNLGAQAFDDKPVQGPVVDGLLAREVAGQILGHGLGGQRGGGALDGGVGLPSMVVGSISSTRVPSGSNRFAWRLRLIPTLIWMGRS